MLKVVKRDGRVTEFDVQKIINAVNKAFISVGEYMPDYLNTMIPALFEDGDVIGVENIQNRIEQLLMNDKHFNAAKSYILYREKHRQRRVKAAEKWDFVQEFVKSDNAANATIDDNSNVGTKGVGVLNAEIH